MGYFDNVNPDLLADADLTARHVLELGGGTGAFAQAYLARNPTADYTCVEYDPASAKLLKQVVPHVVVGDIEVSATRKALAKHRPKGGYDLLIIGDVLEHLRDPWDVMAHLTSLMAKTAQARVCIPNAAHWSVLLSQMCGDWTYADQGMFDRTHLRWFTRDTSIALFREAGWDVRKAQPRIFRQGMGMQVVNALSQIQTWPKTRHVPTPQTLQDNLLPLQWVISSSRGVGPSRHKMAVFGLKTKHDAMVEVRLSRPLATLRGTGHVRARLRIGQQPNATYDWADTAWYYRTHVRSPEQADSFAAKGGLMVLDIDDHPDFLPNHTKNNFLTLNAVHAVTTSTPSLAKVLRQWNPEVHVIENALLELPPERAAPDDGPLHIVYAALNRTDDFMEQCAALVEHMKEAGAQYRVTVLYDKKVAEVLSPHVETRFEPLMKYEDYLSVLQAADVVLMPLLETEFNLVKSDLKILESLAAGARPIISPVVQSLTTVPKTHYEVAKSPKAWVTILKKLVKDREAIHARGLKGRAYIGKNRMLAQQVDQRLALLDDLKSRLPKLEAARQKRMRLWRKKA